MGYIIHMYVCDNIHLYIPNNSTVGILELYTADINTIDNIYFNDSLLSPFTWGTIAYGRLVLAWILSIKLLKYEEAKI